MVANGASTIAVTVTALLFGANAHAQSGPVSAAAEGVCAAEPSQPPCLSISTGPKVELPRDAGDSDGSGTFALFGNLKGTALFQTDTAWTTASFGPTWRLKTGIRYEAAGGVQLTASLIARRGYSLPIAMVQTFGSDVQLSDYRNASLQSGADPILWDTEFRIRKMLLSSDVMDLAVVGEVFNVLKLNRGGEPVAETSVLNSPTVRTGVLLGF